MSDLISREDAINAIYHYFSNMTMGECANVLHEVPSAQPDTCDGCMWEDAFGYGECYRCKRAFSDMYMVKDEE